MNRRGCAPPAEPYWRAAALRYFTRPSALPTNSGPRRASMSLPVCPNSCDSAYRCFFFEAYSLILKLAYKSRKTHFPGQTLLKSMFRLSPRSARKSRLLGCDTRRKRRMQRNALFREKGCGMRRKKHRATHRPRTFGKAECE